MNKSKEELIPPDGGYGWIIVLVCVIANATLLPLTQCFGIIFQNEFQDMGISAAQISFLLHLNNSMYCSLGLLSSPLLKKYTYKQVALLGTFLMSTGIFLTTFANSYGLMLFTVSILTGVGQGILFPALYMATNTYFKKRLTLAISFTVTGASLSPIFMPQICNILLDLYGTKYTVLILSGIALHAYPCCLLLRPLEAKKRVEAEPMLIKDGDTNNATAVSAGEKPLLVQEDKVYNDTTVPKKEDSVFSKLISIFDLDLLKQGSYIIVIVGMGVSFVSELNIVLMVPFVLAEMLNFNRDEVGNFMSIHYTADLLGRLLIPLLAHKMSSPPTLMYCISLLGSCVGRTGMDMFRSSKNVNTYVISVILGLSKGIKAVYQSIIIPKYVSLEKLPAATGLCMVLNGILSLAIGPIIGLVHDVSKSYAYTLYTASAMSISCVLMWAAECLWKRRRKRNAASNDTPSA